jgi:hypothetical protein
VVGIFLWVGGVCAISSPICGIMVIKAWWSLYVFFIGVMYMCDCR